DERPHRIHLLVPKGLRVRLLRQLVQSEANSALYVGSDLWPPLPILGSKQALQLLQEISGYLLDLSLLCLAELGLRSRQNVEDRKLVLAKVLPRRATLLLVHLAHERLQRL